MLGYLTKGFGARTELDCCLRALRRKLARSPDPEELQCIEMLSASSTLAFYTPIEAPANRLESRSPCNATGLVIPAEVTGHR